ncbi:hypothetical protein AJ79_07802 [Helicocarpus griseus UAMH5409]|uniref:Uncharacterized protein n=1 Tax=Helicocarpus griseus UAMH5409 TaxID=1447875 RepID=A0A2B7WYW0_9EURO|nr:hypothetical protein AJ79_07802 [Helicocarpus griseus UAMH5409]
MGFSRLFGQIISQPPLPATDFTGKTVIVTGANVGLGKEAVKHFARLGAKVVGTARSSAKCAAATTEVEAETSVPGRTSFWELDYGSYASVKAFCERATSELERLDAVVLNAGVAMRTFELLEGEESSITVNVISTLLLAILLLPKLRQTAEAYKVTPYLSVTSSSTHAWAKLPERDASEIFAALSDPNTETMRARYPNSKLLQLLAIRELASRSTSNTPSVIINLVSPGVNSTSLSRSSTGLEAVLMKVFHAIFAWQPEVGARTLVYATVAGEKSHGVLIDHCDAANDITAPWIKTDEGQRVQKKVWDDLEKKLEAIEPGILLRI